MLATAGRVFCGGADLSGDKPLADRERRERDARCSTATRCGCSRPQTPIVAAVQGAAVGAGLGLALVADFRVAAPEARFSANFVTLGFHAGFGITHTLPRVIGEQAAALMLLTGRRVKADEALRFGLVDEVAPPRRLRDAAHRAGARDRRERAARRSAPPARRCARDLAQAVERQTEHERAEQDRLMRPPTSARASVRWRSDGRGASSARDIPSHLRERLILTFAKQVPAFTGWRPVA